jgi:hypothetical protein
VNIHKSKLHRIMLQSVENAALRVIFENNVKFILRRIVY